MYQIVELLGHFARLPWSMAWLPTPVYLPGKLMGWEAWQVAVHGVSRVRQGRETNLIFGEHLIFEELQNLIPNLLYNIMKNWQVLL